MDNSHSSFVIEHPLLLMLLSLILIPLAFLGHGYLWVWLINRSHSTTMPHRLCQRLTEFLFAAGGLIPLGFAGGFWAAGWNPLDWRNWLLLPWPVQVYVGLCAMLGVVAFVQWTRRYVLSRVPAVLVAERHDLVNVLPRRGNLAPNVPEHSSLVRLLGAETLRVEVAEKGLELTGLTPALDGLSILHLSDLHFTGKVSRRYFEEVVRLGNALEPDLVAVTGDIIDDSEYIAWVPHTLGKLRARHGVYFVLGNHDLRHDWTRLRQTLVECGLIDLGGRWKEISVRGQRLVLAGNELPWFPPGPDFQDAPPPPIEGGPPRILLAHTPDQFVWAQDHQIDLMLAGHNHGGQIQLPGIGPVFAPSRYGVRYACGVFHDPPTVLHVSRGVSAKMPIRWRCPPEMIKLTLHAAAKEGSGSRKGAKTQRKRGVRMTKS